MSTARSSANLFSHRHNSTDYNSANYTSTSSSPRRPYYKLGGSSGMEDTDGEDEKKLLSLSDRIKKLSSSKILRDNSTLTHNNNEPFTYLKKSKAEPPPLSTSFGQGYSSTLSRDPSLSNKPKREVIYAQVVVDDDKTTRDYLTNGNHSSGTTKNKRTIHRSYNNNDYKNSSSSTNNYRGASTTNSTTAAASHHLNNNISSSSSSNKMRGRNVTTVLLNSSSDDINELSYRDKYSSSPVLFSPDNHETSSYYPKSPAIVMRAQNFQSSNRRYEDAGRQYKSAYHASEDDDEYFRKPKYSDDDEQFRFDKKSSYNRFANSYEPMKFTSEDSSKRRSFAMAHENSYNKQDTLRSSHSHISSRPKFDDYNDHNSRPFGVYDENDDDDPLDQNYNPNFDRFGTQHSLSSARKSKTLERDHSFSKSRLLDTGGGTTTTDHYSLRSRTLDDRLGNKKAGSKTRLIGEGLHDEEEDRKFQVLISNKKETKKSGGVFSTLLRRNPNKSNKGTEGGKVPKESATKVSKSELSTDKSNGGSNKKGGQSTNFFTSFLEKKRKKQSTNKSTNGNAKSSTISSTTATVGSKKEKSQKDNTSSTYQSYSQNWPPPTLTVTDYSDSSPNKGSSFYDREHAVDSNTEQDSVMGSNDIWKKSYGNLATDNAKVKRRWTVRESSKPSVIREEPEPRSLDRNKSFIGHSSTTPRQGYQSIDRRPKKSLPPSDDQTDGYNSFEISKSFRDSISPPKTNKYNTLETRYSPEKSTSGQKYGGDFDDKITTSSRTPIGGSYGRMDKQGTLSRGRKAHKGYAYGGGTPNSSGSESNPRNTNVLGNGSLRSVYLHEAAIIPEMPRTNTASPGGAPSLSGLSGRRTLSKDEISNYSGPRKETKQLSRSMSVVAPWGPTKYYKDKYKELDYSRSNTNLHLPPRPPSRSPSYSRGGSNERALIGNKSVSTKNIQKSKQDAIRGSKQPGGGVKGSKKNFNSSVESLLRQDTPPDSVPNKKGTSKLSRSKSMVAPPSYEGGKRDGKGNRFSTLWFSKKNQK